MGTTPAMQTRPASATRMPGYLIAWRMVIAVLAWWGLVAALHGDITQLRYFSQVTTLTVALTATASVLGFAVVSQRWNRAMAWCRGASTTYAIVTAVIYQALLSGNLEATSSLLEHAVVPALAVIDWLVFGPGSDKEGRARQAWWTALSWLILPICYLGVYYRRPRSERQAAVPIPGSRRVELLALGGHHDRGFRRGGVRGVGDRGAPIARPASGAGRLTAGPLGRRGPRLPVAGEPPRDGWIGNRAKRAQNPILSYAGYIRVRIE